MPIYAFNCDKCALEFEKWQDYDDEKVSICPNCGELAPVKIYPVPAHLKWFPPGRKDMLKLPDPPVKYY